MPLNCRWLGLELKNPLVPSASPLTASLDSAKELEDAGAAAIVMYSLFEETMLAEEESASIAQLVGHTDWGAEGSGFAVPGDPDRALDRYLELLTALKQSLEIPVIASLNGVTMGGWIQCSQAMAAAGADALDLNIYYPAADIYEPERAVEQRYFDILKELRRLVRIPINMKLPAMFSSPGHFIKHLESLGADGVSLFNRFYQADINIDSLRLIPSLHPSTSAEALPAMRWIAIMHGRTGLSLAASGGIHTSQDVIKMLLAGADAVHLCSVLLTHGPAHLKVLLDGLQHWMEEKGFTSVEQFKGRLSQSRVPDPVGFERANYANIIESYRFDPHLEA